MSYPGSYPNRFEILSVGNYFSLSVMFNTQNLLARKMLWTCHTKTHQDTQLLLLPKWIFLNDSGRFLWYGLTFTGVRGLALIFGADLGPEQMTQVTKHQAMRVTNGSSKCVKLHTNAGHDKAPGKSYIYILHVVYVIQG